LGWSGKDTTVNCLTGLLGYDTDNGYVGTLKPEYFDDSRGSAEGATAFLAALAGARLCVISERKQGSTAFDGEKLKPLTEQEGCRIPARKLFKAPQAFTMTAAFIGLSNSQVDLGPSPDDGIKRRFIPDPMPNKFVPKDRLVPGCPPHWRAMDETIKTRARQGVFASEMVFVMQSLYESLFVRDGTNIAPVPMCIQEEQAEIFTTKSKNAVEEWLLANSTGVDLPSDASQRKAVNLRLAGDPTAGVGNRFGAQWKALHEIGVKTSSNGRGLNSYQFTYPGNTTPQYVKLIDLS
jgi:hypothetical protein